MLRCAQHDGAISGRHDHTINSCHWTHDVCWYGPLTFDLHRSITVYLQYRFFHKGLALMRVVDRRFNLIFARGELELLEVGEEAGGLPRKRGTARADAAVSHPFLALEDRDASLGPDMDISIIFHQDREPGDVGPVNRRDYFYRQDLR